MINILNEIKNIIQSRRSKAQLKADIDFEKALANQEFCSTEQRIRELNRQVALYDKEQDKIELKKALENKEKILKKLNLNIEPEYNCKICNDTAYVNRKLCSCAKELINKKIAAICGMQEMQICNFKDCSTQIFGKNKDKYDVIYNKMQSFCERFPDTPYTALTFSGPTGTGKTYLASIIASELSQKGFDVMYLTAFALNNLFLKAHRSSEYDRLSYLDTVLSCDLLIIDDLGTESVYRNVTCEYLYSIINERKIGEKHSIITTNLSLEEIHNRYGERIFSRLSQKNNSLFITFEGDDIRLKK